jgi:hypothetical protein
MSKITLAQRMDFVPAVDFKVRHETEVSAQTHQGAMQTRVTEDLYYLPLVVLRRGKPMSCCTPVCEVACQCMPPTAWIMAWTMSVSQEQQALNKKT